MGTSLSKLQDVPSLKNTQRESLAAFLAGVDSTIERLAGTFAQDVEAIPEARRAPGNRILVRADRLQSNIADELARLNDSAQGGDAWWTDRVSNGRVIVAGVEELSQDMVGFLTTGRVPSEDKARRKLWIFGGVAVAIAAAGTYAWWKNEQAAEAKLQGLIDSGDLEDCGCTGGT